MTQNTKQYFEWEDEPKSAHASECGLKVKGGWSAIYWRKMKERKLARQLLQSQMECRDTSKLHGEGKV